MRNFNVKILIVLSLALSFLPSSFAQSGKFVQVLSNGQLLPGVSNVFDANVGLLRNTLDPYYQSLNAYLSAIAAANSDGVLVRSGASIVRRQIIPGSSKVSINDQTGTSTNFILDVVESNIGLNNLGGTLSVSKGGTARTSFGSRSLLYANSSGVLTDLQGTNKIVFFDSAGNPTVRGLGTNLSDDGTLINASGVGGGGGDMLKVTYDINNNGIVDGVDSVAWASITNKPSTFAPSAHTHPVADLSDSTAAGRALITAADAVAQRAAMGLGSAATSSSGAFATASHAHAGTDITSGTIAPARLGSGSANSGTILYGDNVWRAPLAFDTNANYAIAGNWTFVGSVSFMGTNPASAEMEFFDADASASVTLKPADVTSQSYRIIFPSAPGSGFLRSTVSGSTNDSLAYADFGTSAGTVMEGNDSRVVNATPTSRSITGANSISGGGSLAADRTLALVNDSSSPGANKVYGTDGSGVKGWKNDPAGSGSGTPLTVVSNTVATNINNSFAISASVLNGSVKFLPTAPVTLTDASTVATDASLSQTFLITLGGSRTLGAPTNPTHGQRATWVVIQDSTGGRSLTADTGAGGWTNTVAVSLPAGDFGISTNAGSVTFISGMYLTNTAKWYPLGVNPQN